MQHMPLREHPESSAEHAFLSPDGRTFGGIFGRFRGGVRKTVEKSSIPHLNPHLLEILSRGGCTLETLLAERKKIDPDVSPQKIERTLQSLIQVGSVTFDQQSRLFSITEKGNSARLQMQKRSE